MSRLTSDQHCSVQSTHSSSPFRVQIPFDESTTHSHGESQHCLVPHSPNLRQQYHTYPAGQAGSNTRFPIWNLAPILSRCAARSVLPTYCYCRQPSLQRTIRLCVQHERLLGISIIIHYRLRNIRPSTSSYLPHTFCVTLVIQVTHFAGRVQPIIRQSADHHSTSK